MPKSDGSKALKLDISAKGLKGKQSVRATFRLPEHVIRLLGVAASQLGLKQKSLFDQLMEDADILSKVAERAGVNPISADVEVKRQKTFVLSRRSVDALDEVSRRKNIPRDLLVEVSIKRLVPVVSDEQEKHKKRAYIYKEMDLFLQQGRSLLKKAIRQLGNEDAVCKMIRQNVEQSEQNVAEVRTIIEKGRAMEYFEPVREKS